VCFTTDQNSLCWMVCFAHIFVSCGTLICEFAECTSAVSSDVEGRMYEHAKSLGITLITISLRCVYPLQLMQNLSDYVPTPDLL
jgi:ABC-type uncharacterized transport system fused permease/ATPase subunit